MYLLKTAHELMNPITSSMELINIIEEELDFSNNKINQSNRNKIANTNRIESANNNKEIFTYLKNLNFIMFNFLKDFTYFCEIKTFCKNCQIKDSCKMCGSNNFSIKCFNCITCDSKLARDINLKKTIQDIFDIFYNIINFEGKTGLNINLKYKIKNFMFNLIQNTCVLYYLISYITF